MESKFTRRAFLKTTATALGTVMVFEFSTVAGAKQIVGIRAVSSKGLEKENMPHVIVKLWPGPSEKDKIRLAEAIVKDVVEIVEVGEGSVSVAIEEVSSADWKAKVYDPDIKKNMDKLYKKPGYSM
jgi:4-oxalocrotonate tautomerase